MLKKINYKAFLGMLTVTMGLSLTSCSDIKYEVKNSNIIAIENVFEQDTISLSDLYINFYTNAKKCDITSKPEKSSIKSICLYDLVNYYGYNFEYNKDNSITKEQIEKLIEKINSKIETSELDLNSIVSISHLGFNYDYVIENGILEQHRYLSKFKLGESENFDSLYKNLIIESEKIDKMGNKYVQKGISAIDYILLEDNKVYSKKIDEFLSKVVNITPKDVNELKNKLLQQCPFDYEDNNIRFDPNNKEEIDKAISSYVSLSGNTSEMAAVFYAGINRDLLTEETVSYLKNTYCDDLDECVNKLLPMIYSIYYQKNIEELAVQKSIYNLAKNTNLDNEKIIYPCSDITDKYLQKTMCKYLGIDLSDMYKHPNRFSTDEKWIYYNMCENKFNFIGETSDEELEKLMKKYWYGLNHYNLSFITNSYNQNKDLKQTPEQKVVSYK